MIFLLTLIVTIILAVVLKPLIKKLPWLFYLLAVAVCVLFLAREFVQMPTVIDRPFFYLMQRCTIAEAIFIVVMFIGVFDVRSKIRAWMQPIRTELSVIASLIAIAHVVAYLGTFGARILFGGTEYSIFLQTSLAVSLVLFALLIVLGISSFEFMKKRMKTKTWKKLQYSAYAFYALTYVHILLCLLPPAIAGGSTAQISVVVYTALFAIYVVMRVRRWRVDKKASLQMAQQTA